MAADPALPRHPIAVVAERTGLSQDVLRVWERRYAAVKPMRDSAGQRIYSDADIARLALLRDAVRAGRGISHVARLPTPALEMLVEEDRSARRTVSDPRTAATDASPVDDALVEDALALALALDGQRLHELLRRGSARLGVAGFLETLAAPLLRRVGDEWHAGRMSPAQEHLVSSAVHDIAAATLRAFAPPAGAPRVVVATPSGDRHVIGATLVGAAAAVEGWNVIYLGADLPAPEIATAARASGARLVALSVVFLDSRERVLSEIEALHAALPAAVSLIAGGTGAAALAAPLGRLGVRVESTIAGLVAELRRQSEQVPASA